MTESSNEKMVKLTCPMDDCQWQYDSMFSRDQSFKIINMHFDSVHNQQAQQQVNTAKAEEKGGNGSTIIRQPNIVHTETDEILVKKNLFIQSLCGHLRQLFVEERSYAYAVARDHPRQLMSDLLDLQDPNIIDEIRNNLKSHHFVILFVSNKVGEREGLIHFLQQFTANIERLDVVLTPVWSDDDLKRFFRTLQRPSKIEELLIGMCGSSSIPSIDDVISILPQVTNKLMLRFHDVNVGVGLQREFCEKLKEGIKMFDTTKLQTQELNVRVQEYRSKDETLHPLLHVVLSRGEAARIIESKF